MPFLRFQLPDSRKKPGLALISCALAALFLIAFRIWPQQPLADTLGTSRAVYARGGELLRLTLAPDQQYRLWTPLADISPTLVEAVLAYEDRSFYWHPGVNPVSLVRAAVSTATGQRRQGGSTLTMQLARRLYGINSRSMTGKLAQIAGALWLELRYSKHDILQAYLNTAPYGGNMEGVGAASLIYFHKPAKDLSLPEALTLAVIPQNPVKRIAERGRNAELQAARQRLVEIWAKRNPQAQQQIPEVQLGLNAAARSALPFIAPHATDMLLAQRPGERAIHSTIDLRMQRTLERVLGQYLKGRADIGLSNASALLLDASTMQVRAVIGSADHRNDAIAGQVNGTLARRSPGSTLKPFIYALALDQGLLHPKTVLKDAPTSFGPFSPENFDNRFAGPIAAQDALIRSRNVPAVAVAAKLRKPGLYDFMKLAGVSRLQSEQHYGLALVLGGGEVTMEELASMYAVLANGGQSQSLAYSSDKQVNVPSSQPLQLLSEEAAFITLDMLRQTPRPDTTSPAKPAIAWKTGTSWGFRDAWTAGVFGRHVLVVWLGNFDGSSNPALVGVDAAAPLFLRMVDALRAERLDPGEMATTQSPHLQQVEVCAATGGLPDALCPIRTTAWFIAGKSPITASSLHRAVWVDERSGKVVCGPQAHAKRQVVEQWGSDMQRLFAQAGLPRSSVAEPDCSDAASKNTKTGTSTSTSTNSSAGQAAAPVITSPLRGVSYSIRMSRPTPISLRAEAASGVRQLYWFADDALIGKASPGESLAWQPASPRTYLLRVVDDAGRAESREVNVELVP
jgi:penicillin-binding protein 1C